MTSAAQLLRQAEPLKASVSDASRNISETWVIRQRLEDLYKKLLLMDLEYALDKKVEQDLWNHAFKNQINNLQAQAKDKQNPKRAEIQASLNLFLETASGFYLQLLQLLCSTFKLDLPFRRKSSVYGVLSEKCALRSKVTQPKKSSCWYICQHCLVHLGDIARYRQQVDQAQTFYWHAANLVPYNGQPYNQLAILEAARGNKLSTVFYHIRSLAVRHPFPVAATNLEKFYSKILKDIGDFKGKLSLSEVLTAFLQFHAHIHMCTDLNRAETLVEKLLSSLPAHVTSQSFHTHVLIQIIGINIFAMHHARRMRNDQTNDSDSNNSHEELTHDEERCYFLVFTLTISLLDVLLQYTPKMEQKVKEFFTLPAIKVLLDWLFLNKDSFHQEIVKTSGLWGSLSKLLNTIQPTATQDEKKKTDLTKYDNLPLPEDVELRSFQPIEKSHSGYSFSKLPSEGLPYDIEIQLRCKRLVNLGKQITEDFQSLSLLSVQTQKSGKLQFSSQLNPKKHVTVTIPTSIIQSEKKSVRQNVAIQAIMQKQTQTVKSSAVKDQDPVSTSIDSSSVWAAVEILPKATTSILLAGRQTSPKYLLAVPTSNPQFLKAGTAQLPPNPSPRHRQQLQQQQQHQQQKQQQPQQLIPAVTSQMDRSPSPSAILSNPSFRGPRPQTMSPRASDTPPLNPPHQGIRVPPPSMNPPTQGSGRGAPPLPFGQRPFMPPNQYMPFQGERMPYQNQFPQLNASEHQQFPFTNNPDQTPSLRPQMHNSQVSGVNSFPTSNPNVTPGKTHHSASNPMMPQVGGPFVPPLMGKVNLNQPPPSLPPNQQYDNSTNPMQFTSPPGPERTQHPLQPEHPPVYGQQPQQHPPYKSTSQIQNNKLYQQQQQQQQQKMIPGSASPGYPFGPLMGLPNNSIGMSSSQTPALGTATAPILTPNQNRSQATPSTKQEDGTPCISTDPMSAMSQLTIQPPKPTVSEMSKLSPLTSRFLGHAEGTPKPENYNKNLQSPIRPVSQHKEHQDLQFFTGFVEPPTGRSAQQGTYSLFSSNSPWTVHISSAGDSKSIASSPFSSQPSSMRSSPDHTSKMHPGNQGMNMGLRFVPAQGEEWSGPPPSDAHSNAPNNQENNVDSLWSSNGPSPLERLLELQRQRQTDAH